MDSILTSVKKMLGITEEYTHFDTDIIIHINSVFMILSQLGVGPEGGFTIQDASTTWDEYISGSKAELVKSYIFLKVRLLFDPPESTAAIEAIKNQINEFEWRLFIFADPVEKSKEDLHGQ